MQKYRERVRNIILTPVPEQALDVSTLNTIVIVSYETTYATRGFDSNVEAGVTCRLVVDE